jgi:hypothetical protein
MREGVDPIEQLGQADLARLHPPPSHFYGGPAGQVGGLGLQGLHEVGLGNAPAGVEPAEGLVGEVPLASQETLGLANGPVEGEVLKTL